MRPRLAIRRKGAQGNAGIYTGAAALAANNALQQSQDTLFALASDTGGKALFDMNDLPQLSPGPLCRETIQPIRQCGQERQLEDALMLEDPITDLSIAMEIDHFQLNRAKYFVPIVVKILGRELAPAKRGRGQDTLIDFVGEIRPQQR